MKHFNNGTVFTQPNCIACNKCISECNVFGANVCISERRKNSIVVDANKCVQCGNCIDTCPQNARDFKDDSDDFLQALNNKEKITVLISPEFSFLYEKEAPQIIAYLKEIGVAKVYDSSIGEDIAAWANAKYIKDNKDYEQRRGYIANTCPSILGRILKYNSGLVSRIIPIQNPAVCAAIYVNKYLKDTNKIAYLGSCIALKNEAMNVRIQNNINYVLSYKHLIPKLREMALNVKDSEFDSMPLKPQGKLVIHGNFKKKVGQYFPSNIYFSDFEGTSDDIFKLLTVQRYSQNKRSQPYLVDLISCKNGCVSGPAIEKYTNNLENILLKYLDIAENSPEPKSWEENWNDICTKFKALNAEDFNYVLDNKYKQPFSVPETTYENIFELMLKTTEAQKHVDCGSCGYKSCYEMAKAIAFGINKKENCIHYMNQQLMATLITDPVTKLPNSKGYMSQVSEMMMKNPQKKYTIFQGDVNRLKVINDLYTMKKGDIVLLTIANTLKAVVKDRGICGRLGGGTFSVCIENTEENIRDILEINSFDCKHIGIEFPITVRFGVYSQNENPVDLITMMNGATICMDKNISHSQNTFTFFNERFRKNTQQEIEITSRIQFALENHEFSIWFQPQYKAVTGELVGAEVLCRWNRSDGTILQPDVFIPIAEKNGYIRKLDIEIWRLAFSTMHNWMNKGLPLIPLSVNISRVSLQNDSFIYTIMNLSRDYEVPPRLIHFEITESAYITDQRNMISRITKLRNLGYKIAMDDFGSGYSSLNTLKDMPIDILKLDMGFLRDQTNMDKGGRIISSLAQMAQSLEYTTIAEGVETQEQADFLKGIGIDVIQGFLYSKPIPENQYISLLSNQKNTSNKEKYSISSVLDINNFYNPSSTESIIFDKVLGAAAIYEYNAANNRISLVKINQQALSILGLEDLSYRRIQKSLKQYFTEETLNTFLETIQKCIQTESEAICIVGNKEFINNQQIYMKVHTSVISQKGSSYYIFTNIEDVTDELSSTAKKATSSNYMYSLIDNSLAGMALVNLKIDLLNAPHTVNLKVLKINKEVVELIGYTEEEIKSIHEKQFLDIIHPLDRTAFFMKATNACANGFTKPYTFTFRAKNVMGKYTKVKILVLGIKQEDGSYMLMLTFVNQDL